MTTNSTESPTFKNILHLTDFSSRSDAALTWAIDIARANGATLSVLHVLIPDVLAYMTPDSPASALDLQEQWASQEMRQIEHRLADLPHHTIVARGKDVWSAIERRLPQLQADLIVLGTHGKTGLTRILMGSVAEGVLRRSTVPVMTVGPGVPRGLGSDGKFHRILLATDFKPGSVEAAGYAMSFAQRNQAELVLVHACKKSRRGRSRESSELSVAEALHKLNEIVPGADALQQRPEMLVEFGEPGSRILDITKRKETDLIVMGVRSRSVFAATHLEGSTVHNVVAQARCPVLTVRPRVPQAA